MIVSLNSFPTCADNVIQCTNYSSCLQACQTLWNARDIYVFTDILWFKQIYDIVGKHCWLTTQKHSNAKIRVNQATGAVFFSAASWILAISYTLTPVDFDSASKIITFAKSFTLMDDTKRAKSFSLPLPSLPLINNPGLKIAECWKPCKSSPLRMHFTLK